MPTTKLTLPTGYESRLSQIERRRKLVEALLAGGLQGSGPNTISIFQALAPVLQAVLAARMDRRLDRRQDELGEEMRGAYSKALSEMNADIEAKRQGGLTADENREIAMTWGNNPWTADAAKPFMGAMEAGLKSGQEVTDVAGVQLPRSAIPIGSPTSIDINDLVIRDPATGEIVVNPIRTSAGQIAGGTADPYNPPLTRMADPNAGLLQTIMQQQGMGQPVPGPVSGPVPGTIEEGYRFKGGNPADPNSWELVGGGVSNGPGSFRGP